MRSSTRWILGLSLVGLVFVGYQGVQSTGTQAAQPAVKPAPDFVLPEYRGQGNLRLSDLKGKVVLVNFYETVCPYCQRELADFNRVYGELKPKGLEIVGISLDQDGLLDGSRQVAALASRHQVRFPLLIGNDEVADRYGGIDSVPMSFLVDRQGRLVRTFPGAVDARALKEAIAPLL